MLSFDSVRGCNQGVGKGEKEMFMWQSQRQTGESVFVCSVIDVMHKIIFTSLCSSLALPVLAN